MLQQIKYKYQRYHYYFPLIIALLLPFGVPFAPIIALWIIAFFWLNDDVKIKTKQAFQNKWLYVFWSFFFLHVIGYFFSNNKAEAIWNIEIKLTFFILPFLFFATTFKEIEKQKIKWAFVLGCLLLLVICIARALYYYFIEQTNYFYYSDFTYFLHPSYFAMYLTMAILIMMLDVNYTITGKVNTPRFLTFKGVPEGGVMFSPIINVIITLFLLIGVFLASSKMGLISAILLLPVTLGFILFNKGYKKMVIALLFILIATMSLSYKLFPTPYERIKKAFWVSTSTEQIDKTSAESTAVRILIWKEAIAIIKQNPLFGVTPGNTNDVLFDAYKKEGLTGALSKKLNAHNQFLQTFIGTGIIGFVLLLSLTFGLAVWAIIKRHYLALLFSILIILNFLVESMLQSQAGFIFFLFFSCLLLNPSLITHHLSLKK